MPKHVKRKKQVREKPTPVKKKTMHGRGESHYKSIVTAKDVLEIRRLWATNEVSLGWLSDKYGIHRSSVYDIVTGRTWRSV